MRQKKFFLVIGVFLLMFYGSLTFAQPVYAWGKHYYRVTVKCRGNNKYLTKTLYGKKKEVIYAVMYEANRMNGCGKIVVIYVKKVKR